VALSHCWCKHRLLTTRKENISEHCKEIQFASLPETFQDAVTVTRTLGVQYLWIDSLCIIQDDPDDWRRGSVQMGSIYRDAAITIAASGAKDGTEGCFMPRPTPSAPISH
ncbi:heterokaryon incompatibility, partial [Diplogelasinospora grovesii]